MLRSWSTLAAGGTLQVPPLRDWLNPRPSGRGFLKASGGGGSQGAAKKALAAPPGGPMGSDRPAGSWTRRVPRKNTGTPPPWWTPPQGP